MKVDLVFKHPSNARKEAFFDPECYQKGGYILKKFSDGYRYFPLDSQKTYVIRNSQVVELGQYISTFYWWLRHSETETRSQSNCRVVPFKTKKQSLSSKAITSDYYEK